MKKMIVARNSAYEDLIMKGLQIFKILGTELDLKLVESILGADLPSNLY